MGERPATTTRPKASRNFVALLWHATFLALASNFMDVDTIIPSMLIKAGGTAVHLGFLTAIMMGGSSLMQLVFAGFISHKPLKRRFLLWGINLRIVALYALALLFFFSDKLAGGVLIILIFVFIAQFSFSGAFANISYVDIVGKSIKSARRKAFISTKQIIRGVGVFVSAFVARQILVSLDFPENYALLFLLAASLLFIASVGFWRIDETPTRGEKRRSFLAFVAMIPSAVRANRNLKLYLLLINSLGLGLSVLPFVIYFAKENFPLTGAVIGNILLLKVVGMFVAGTLLLKYAQRFRYRDLLLVSLTLAAAIPVASLLLKDAPSAYPFIFVFSGFFMATYKTATEGILLEISTDQNRATYAGISGAGNILTTVFPLFAGFLLEALGYTVVFIGVSVVVLLSSFFVLRLDCRPPLQHRIGPPAPQATNQRYR